MNQSNGMTMKKEQSIKESIEIQQKIMEILGLEYRNISEVTIYIKCGLPIIVNITETR